MLAKQLIWTQEEKHKTFSWLEKRKNQKSRNRCQQFLLSSPFTDTLLDLHIQSSPSARVKKEEQTLMFPPGSGQMGKGVTRGSSGAPGTAHWGALWGWRWQSGVRACPQGHHTTRADSPGAAPSHRENWGQRQGWSTPNKQKRICCLGKDWQKRCEKSWSFACQMCWGTGRLEGNICWLPLGKENQEKQKGSYYNIGTQLESK